jgi:hypothetical protein
MGSHNLLQAEAETIPEDDGRCLQGTPALGKNGSEINVPTVIRKGTGRMNVPNESGTPKKSPQTRGKGQIVEGKYEPACRDPAPGRKAWLI